MADNPHWLTDAEIQQLGEQQNQTVSSDPVSQYHDRWYFWDEVWCGCFGPFDTREAADASLTKYCKENLGM